MHNTKIKKDQKKIKQSKTIQKVYTNTTEFLFCLSFICWLEAYLEMWLKLSNTPLEKSNFFSLQIGTNCRLFLDWRSEASLFQLLYVSPEACFVWPCTGPTNAAAVFGSLCKSVQWCLQDTFPWSHLSPLTLKIFIPSLSHKFPQTLRVLMKTSHLELDVLSTFFSAIGLNVISRLLQKETSLMMAEWGTDLLV